MNDQSYDQSYTYRAGQRMPLAKAPDQFVVRMPPEAVQVSDARALEPVSPHATRVTVDPARLDAAMAEARTTAVTHHAYCCAETGAEFLITDRVLVRFRAVPTPAALDAFAARHALRRLADYGERDFLFQLTEHTGMNPVKLVVALTEHDPDVETADHDLNLRMKRYQLALPADPSYPRQWHLHRRLMDPQFDPRASSRCEEAWTLLGHYGSAEAVVGVTDDGCRLDHGDFAAPGKFAGWAYFVGNRLVRREDPDAEPQRMYEAGSNHGTSCAAVIAGDADGRLTVGAAPGCRLLPVKWEAQGPSLLISDSKLLAALDYLGPRVDIVSNSWGGVPISLWSQTVVARLAELARSGGRRGRGILFLWAAGNENCPISHEAAEPVPYDDGWQVRADGSWVWVGVSRTRSFRNNLVGIDGLMHVAALASTARRSHYSNYGPGILIAAPSNNVHEYQRLSVPGLGITTATGTTAKVTAGFGGTSSATPLVAGIAALALSAHPLLSALELGALLRRTAAKDLDFERYARTPPASYDPDPSWDVSPVAPFAHGEFAADGGPDGSWSPWYGHGRADAANAVAEALRLRGGVPPDDGGGEPAPTTTLNVRHASTPRLAIPDNDATGIADRIAVPEAGTLANLRVEVDIAHPWIGDLRVSLLAPGGQTVVLHERAGGNADDLRRAWEPVTAPALAALLGKPARGDWTLRVADLARSDIGRLNGWALALELRVPAAGPTELALDDTPGLTIPDAAAAGIERALRVDAEGPVRRVEVAVDITHPWIGDLTVDLLSPAGTVAPLHARAGGSADNLIVRYADTAALRALAGETAAGDWRLRVVDHARADVGKLNRWSLKLVVGG